MPRPQGADTPSGALDSSAPASAGERLRGLLAAHRLVAAELDLPTMLERITSSACELVGARSGLLGVLGPDGEFDRVVRHGPPDGAEHADRAAAAELDDPRPLDPSAEPAWGRDPARRLAVPISAGDTVFGNLFLAQPAAGRFSAEDEELVSTLAALAGSAIHNARLYSDARSNAAWLQAAGDIARTLLRDADDDMLAEVLSKALAAGDADFGALIVPSEGGDLEVLSTAGLGAEEYLGRIFAPEHSQLGRAITDGAAAVFADFAEWSVPGVANPRRFGPAMVAPMVDADGLRGAVLLIRTAHRPPFTRRDVELAATFATQVALALQFDDARADSAQVAVLEDRQRIARDLHDNVMQRLFATGIGLQVLAGQQATPETSARVQRHIAELDETIDEIRSRVFTLSDGGESAGPMSHEGDEDDTVARAAADNQPGRRRFPSAARPPAHNGTGNPRPRSDTDDRSASAGHPHLPARRP